MSNSTTLLDLISPSQSQKETTANALLDAASPAMLYGRRAVTTAALTWGFYGGYAIAGGSLVSVANGTLALTASTTNYVEANPATGAVSVNTTAFTAGRIPLYQIVTGTATVTSYTDLRGFAFSTASSAVAVIGPASATDGDFVFFDGTTGKLVKDSSKALSIDGTFAANSDAKVPTEKAVKTYVASAMSGGSSTALDLVSYSFAGGL